MKKLSKRQQTALLLPYVHLLKNPKSCDGWMRDRKVCKNPAYWKFRGMRTRSAWSHASKSGTFCWSHLISRGVYGSMEDEERTDRAFRELGVRCSSSKMVVSDYDGREYEQFCQRSAHADPFHHGSLYHRTYDDDYAPLRCNHNWTDDE